MVSPTHARRPALARTLLRGFGSELSCPPEAPLFPVSIPSPIPRPSGPHPQTPGPLPQTAQGSAPSTTSSERSGTIRRNRGQPGREIGTSVPRVRSRELDENSGRSRRAAEEPLRNSTMRTMVHDCGVGDRRGPNTRNSERGQ